MERCRNGNYVVPVCCGFEVVSTFAGVWFNVLSLSECSAVGHVQSSRISSVAAVFREEGLTTARLNSNSSTSIVACAYFHPLNLGTSSITTNTPLHHLLRHPKSWALSFRCRCWLCQAWEQYVLASGDALSATDLYRCLVLWQAAAVRLHALRYAVLVGNVVTGPLKILLKST